uniref:SFRICE_037171 n=1 Tax=Spodoptera frugiperda TaxID=7108 RepID=A0A2H1WWP9_SPOFR
MKLVLFESRIGSEIPPTTAHSSFAVRGRKFHEKRTVVTLPTICMMGMEVLSCRLGPILLLQIDYITSPAKHNCRRSKAHLEPAPTQCI